MPPISKKITHPTQFGCVIFYRKKLFYPRAYALGCARSAPIPQARLRRIFSCSRSAIMAINSELVGLPLAEFTV